MARRLNEDYNGWKNWATWYANMVFQDDFPTVSDIAYENNYDAYDFSEALKSYFYNYIMFYDGSEIDSVVKEYAEYGFEQIDFYELAETYLQDVDRDED